MENFVVSLDKKFIYWVEELKPGTQKYWKMLNYDCQVDNIDLVKFVKIGAFGQPEFFGKN